MGLAGVKKRSKLSHDPNNTAWSKSTTNFGHKMLSKQGWKPGEYLGAENANHSEHYTAANASHIRVMLREDNLGIGAKIGGGSAETFGLSMFSGLLGRLNGKSEDELKQKEDQVRDAELRTYTGRKFGYMNFVSGGLLVGDKMEEKPAALKSSSKKLKSSSKKRKAEDEADDAGETPKEKKKSKKSETDSKSPTGTESEASAIKKDSKKDKKRKAEKHEQDHFTKDESDSTSQSEDAAKEDKRKRKERRRAEKAAKASKTSSEDDEKTRLKQEKRARKEERRRRKEEKRQKRAAKEKASTQPSTTTSESEGTARPPAPINPGGRAAVRQRYIASKRMASMDPQALKEIFMMQAKAAA